MIVEFNSTLGLNKYRFEIGKKINKTIEFWRIKLLVSLEFRWPNDFRNTHNLDSFHSQSKSLRYASQSNPPGVTLIIEQQEFIIC